MTTTLAFIRERLTETQRRRAEALILVTLLFPTADPPTSTVIANWIITGRWNFNAPTQPRAS